LEQIYHETPHQTKDNERVAKPRKIEITIQTDRRLVIYATGAGGTWCRQCGADREFVTLQTAGLLANSMLGNLANGELPPSLHLSDLADGSPRVCLESLLQLANVGKAAPEAPLIRAFLPEKPGPTRPSKL
jgi:hypothetical protein